MLKKLFSVFSFFACFNCLAEEQISCLTKIGKHQQNFLTQLEQIIGKKELNQKNIKDNEQKIYNLVAANVLTACLNTSNLSEFNNDIVSSQNISIPFEKNEKYYTMELNTEKLFDHINIPSGILVTPFLNKAPGDIITKAQMPTDYFFSSDCSDHWVRVNIDDDTPINKAGKASFARYSGREFFLDFPVGSYNRAFPGLVISAKTGVGAAEEIVYYQNYKNARIAAESFAQALSNTQCALDGLAVYVVSLNTKRIGSGDKSGWAIGSGVVGGSMALLGAAWLTATYTTASATVLMSTAMAANAIPVAGWIAGAVIAVAAAVAAIYPSDLADIQQVMVLDGPYIIK